jgi:hypothetical protein
MEKVVLAFGKVRVMNSSAPMKLRSPKRVANVWSPNYLSTMAPIVVVTVNAIVTTFNSSLVNGNGNVNGIAIGSGGVGPSTIGHGLVPTFNLIADCFLIAKKLLWVLNGKIRRFVEVSM